MMNMMIWATIPTKFKDAVFQTEIRKLMEVRANMKMHMIATRRLPIFILL